MSIVVGFGILLGVVECFFGYRLLKPVLALTGFMVVGALAASLGYALSQMKAVALLAGLVGGVIGIAVVVALYFVGIFLLGAFLGGILGAVGFAVAGSHPEPLLLLLSAILGGAVALLFQKFMIVVSTSFGGSWSVVSGIAYFMMGVTDPTHLERLLRSGGSHRYALLLFWLALGIAGVVVQYRSLPAPEEQMATGGRGG